MGVLARGQEQGRSAALGEHSSMCCFFLKALCRVLVLPCPALPTLHITLPHLTTAALCIALHCPKFFTNHSHFHCPFCPSPQPWSSSLCSW